MTERQIAVLRAARTMLEMLADPDQTHLAWASNELAGAVDDDETIRGMSWSEMADAIGELLPEVTP